MRALLNSALLRVHAVYHVGECAPEAQITRSDRGAHNIHEC